MHPTQRRAVIDLGTNTFHLLIAEVAERKLVREVYRERIFVKLASEGIATIGDAPFGRGISALRKFRRMLDEHLVTRVEAIGTAALRTATNGESFVQKAKEEASIAIRLIDGDKEAEYITEGVLLAIPPVAERILIMDIGGGSTEFIIAGQDKVFWRRSFPLGVSVLFNKFHKADPISEKDLSALEAHLKASLLPLKAALSDYPTHHLVGAAGTFDVLAERLEDSAAVRHATSHQLKLADFPALYDRIIRASLSERRALPDVPEARADMIVVAMVLLRFVFDLAGVERVTVSDYAMKEGILVARPQDAG